MSNYIDPNRLELGEEIGKGAFGVVLRGTFRDVDGQTHEVAIKQVVDESAPAPSSSAPTPRENFMKEVSITIPISKDSEHVVQCHGWTATRNGKLALVMSLYDKSLYALIDEQDGRKLPLEEVVKIALDMAKGLLELHTKGIVFEDLKPSNVLLDAGRRAFLADFGVSKPMKDLSKVYTRNAAGTYYFMPPEKLRSRMRSSSSVRVGFAADIWSFGITVFQLLQSDFDEPYGPGIDVPDIVLRLHMDKEAPHVPAVPEAPELQHTLQACLSLDHNERPSAAQLVQAFQRILRHLGADTQPLDTAAQNSPASQDAAMLEVVLQTLDTPPLSPRSAALKAKDKAANPSGSASPLQQPVPQPGRRAHNVFIEDGYCPLRIVQNTTNWGGGHPDEFFRRSICDSGLAAEGYPENVRAYKCSMCEDPACVAGHVWRCNGLPPNWMTAYLTPLCGFHNRLDHALIEWCGPGAIFVVEKRTHWWQNMGSMFLHAGDFIRNPPFLSLSSSDF